MPLPSRSLSAAFDTNDHDILITRLSSWFGIHGSVLGSIYTCHLIDSVSNVKPTSLPGHILLWCPPRLCSQSCHLHNSRIVSSCSLNRHLYADETQLFLSFIPTHFNSSIDHLQKSRNSNFLLDDWSYLTIYSTGSMISYTAPDTLVTARLLQTLRPVSFRAPVSVRHRTASWLLTSIPSRMEMNC